MYATLAQLEKYSLTNCPREIKLLRWWIAARSTLLDQRLLYVMCFIVAESIQPSCSLIFLVFYSIVPLTNNEASPVWESGVLNHNLFLRTFFTSTWCPRENIQENQSNHFSYFIFSFASNFFLFSTFAYSLHNSPSFYFDSQFIFSSSIIFETKLERATSHSIEVINPNRG